MNENNNKNNIELKEIDYEININQKEEEMYNIIVYPEEEDPDDNFIINLPKNISYSKNEFETKIKYELSLKYYEFTELSNLKLKQIYIENNGNKIPFNFPSENEKITFPSNNIYIELISDNVWVSTEFNIEMNNYNVQVKADLKLDRDLTSEEINKILLKRCINFWHNAYQNKPEVLQYIYIITEFKVFHGSNDKTILKKENNNLFNLQINIKAIFTPLEELAFDFLQDKYKNVIEDEKWRKFKELNSFFYFSYDPLFEAEFSSMKTLIRSSIIKLNKQKKLYLYFSNSKIEEYFSEDEESPSSNEKNSTNFELCILPKITRLNLNNLSKVNSENSLRFKNIKNNIYNNNNKTSESQLSFNKSKKFKNQEDLDDINNSKKNSKESKLKKNFEEINFVAKKLYKAYEEENNDDNDINNVTFTESTDNDLQRNLISYKKDFNIQIPLIEILTMNQEFSKIINKRFCMNLIENNSIIQLKNLELDKILNPKIKNYSFKIFINSEIKELLEIQKNRKNKLFLIIIKDLFIFILIFLFLATLIYFFKKN